jgi:hypothetical protein
MQCGCLNLIWTCASTDSLLWLVWIGDTIGPAGYSLATHKFIIVHPQRGHAKGFYENKFDEFSTNISKIGGFYTRNKKNSMEVKEIGILAFA